MTKEEVWQNVSQIVAGFPLLECDRTRCFSYGMVT
jgi:hypothetical protein